MITPEQFQLLLPLAYAWAEEQERIILRDGVALTCMLDSYGRIYGCLVS